MLFNICQLGLITLTECFYFLSELFSLSSADFLSFPFVNELLAFKSLFDSFNLFLLLNQTLISKLLLDLLFLMFNLSLFNFLKFFLGCSFYLFVNISRTKKSPHYFDVSISLRYIFPMNIFFGLALLYSVLVNGMLAPWISLYQWSLFTDQTDPVPG